MIYILHRPNTATDRRVDDFTAELEAAGLEYELIDPNSREGTIKIELYGVMDYPAVLVTRDDGSVIQTWVGEVPRATDVSYFAHL